MKGSLIDRVARILASDTGVDPKPLTRRDVVVRGMLGAVAVATAGRLGLPESASASPAGCKSLAACLDRADRAASDTLRACKIRTLQRKTWDEFWEVDCLVWEAAPVARKGHRDCLAKCPPPKKPKKPPRKPSRPGDPPPLPPNPYDDVANECANCASVNGTCCWGGPDPEHLCACANPYVGCRVYGCG
jgi:hypothetical protein